MLFILHSLLSIHSHILYRSSKLFFKLGADSHWPSIWSLLFFKANIDFWGKNRSILTNHRASKEFCYCTLIPNCLYKYLLKLDQVKLNLLLIHHFKRLFKISMDWYCFQYFCFQILFQLSVCVYWGWVLIHKIFITF